MGEVVPFKRPRPQPKLTGFLPPEIVTRPPRALSRDPLVTVFTAVLTLGFLPLIAAEVWFADGWRDR